MTFRDLNTMRAELLKEYSNNWIRVETSEFIFQGFLKDCQGRFIVSAGEGLKEVDITTAYIMDIEYIDVNEYLEDLRERVDVRVYRHKTNEYYDAIIIDHELEALQKAVKIIEESLK